MKNSNWLTLALLALAAAVLRAAQCRGGFDAEGLAVKGNLPGMLLLVLLVLAAAYFILAARKLPARRDAAGGLGDVFAFRSMPAAACAVCGAFLAAAGAALFAMGASGSLVRLLLAVFAIEAAAVVLYAVFALYRGKPVQNTALLSPACCLVVYLIFLYRADAADPVLARIYIELLAVVALTLSALERAAFAFQNGSPRVYPPVSAMAVVLSAAAAAELRSPASFLLFAGCAFIEFGFLFAVKFEK